MKTIADVLNENEVISIHDSYVAAPDSWAGLVESLVKELITLGWNRDLHQVKEKFGGLRFYIGTGTDAMYKVISKYESLSYKTCDTCGSADAEVKDRRGWLRAMCNNCVQVEEDGIRK